MDPQEVRSTPSIGDNSRILAPLPTLTGPQQKFVTQLNKLRELVSTTLSFLSHKNPSTGEIELLEGLLSELSFHELEAEFQILADEEERNSRAYSIEQYQMDRSDEEALRDHFSDAAAELLLDVPEGRYPRLFQLLPFRPDSYTDMRIDHLSDFTDSDFRKRRSSQPIRVTPLIKLPVSSIALENYIEEEDLSALSRWYCGFGNRLALRSHHFAAQAPKEMQALQEVLGRLSGIAEGWLPESMQFYQDTPQLIVEPFTDIWTDGTGWTRHVRSNSYVLPFGSLKVHKEVLIALQAGVTTGDFKAAFFTIDGPIDLELLQWLFPEPSYGANPIELDPIPDVHVLLKVRRPGGGHHLISLKAGRPEFESLRVALEHTSELTDQDQKFLSQLFQHLSNDRSAHPGNLFCSDPDYEMNFESFKDYKQAQNAWNEQLGRRINSDPPAGLDRGNMLATDPSLSDRQNVARAIEEELAVIANAAPPQKRKLFTLTPKEKLEFINHYLIPLNDDCARNRAQVEHLAATNALHLLRQDGFNGPDTLYLLTFRYLVMDRVVDYRRRQMYISRAAEEGRKVSLDEVPEWAGRSYNSKEFLLEPKDLPQLLEQRRSLRSAYALLTDPLNERKSVRWEACDLPKIQNKLDEINFNRIMEEYTRLASSPPSFKDERISERLRLAVATWSEENSNKQLESEAIKIQKRTALSELHQRLQKDGIQGDALRTALRTAELPYLKQLQDVEDNRNKTRSVLFKIFCHELPQTSEKVSMKLDRIVERVSVKFTYSLIPGEKPGEVKLILNEEGAYLPTRALRSHSEHSEGLGNCGAGQIQLSLYEKVFYDVQAWQHFDQNREQIIGNLKWFLSRGDDGSGHFQPGPNNLGYQKKKTEAELSKVGIDCKRSKWVDIRAPGLSFQFRMFENPRLKKKVA